ncbi:MAG: hypothetical protein Q9224_003568 [Gallowayella concinna]
MLRIDVPPGPYKAGSPVSGTVSLHGDCTLKVQTVKISLKGRCKTKITESGSNNNKVHHRGRVPLFEYEKILFTGPYSMNPPHEWQFEFRFPEQCEASGLNQFQSSSEMFNEDQHQPLPASFSHVTSSFIGADVDAFVRYELEAALVTPPGSRGDMEITKLLTLKTERYEQNPEPDSFFASQRSVVQSLYLAPGYEHRNPTFREKLKAEIHSSKLPKAQHVLAALLPTVGVIGRRVPLTLGVTYDEDYSTTISAPRVFLRNVKVRLVSTTTVRCVSDSLWSSDDVSDSNQDELPLGEQDFNDQNVELTDRMDVGELMDLKIMAREAFGSLTWVPLVPSFKTFNIVRSYSFKVYVVTECGKKKSHPEFTSPNFVLLAEDYSPPSGSSFAGVLVDAENDDTAILPSYKTAIKS